MVESSEDLRNARGSWSFYSSGVAKQATIVSRSCLKLEWRSGHPARQQSRSPLALTSIPLFFFFFSSLFPFLRLFYTLFAKGGTGRYRSAWEGRPNACHLDRARHHTYPGEVMYNFSFYDRGPGCRIRWGSVRAHDSSTMK